MLTVQVGPPAEILPWPYPSGVVAGTPFIRVDKASGAVIRGDSKHRWPAWPHPVFGLEPRRPTQKGSEWYPGTRSLHPLVKTETA